MEKEPLAALIAVAGVLISALVALIASLKVARNESAKLRVEAKKLTTPKYSTYVIARILLCTSFSASS